MDLKGRLSDKKDAIIRRWLDVLLESYPADTAVFLKTRKNEFANPVGHSFLSGLDKIFDGILQGHSFEALSPFLDSIIRIRAVQEMDPSQAMAFLFDLKHVIRAELGKSALDGSLAEELVGFDAVIDGMALFSFDLYMKCREKLYDIKVQESKRSTYRLLQKAKMVCEIEDPDYDAGDRNIDSIKEKR